MGRLLRVCDETTTVTHPEPSAPNRLSSAPLNLTRNTPNNPYKPCNRALTSPFNTCRNSNCYDKRPSTEPYSSSPHGSPPGGAQPPEELPARGGHAADAGTIAATGVQKVRDYLEGSLPQSTVRTLKTADILLRFLFRNPVRGSRKSCTQKVLHRRRGFRGP